MGNHLFAYISCSLRTLCSAAAYFTRVQQLCSCHISCHFSVQTVHLPFHSTSYLFVDNSGTKRATENPLTFLETREQNAADDIRLLSVASVVYPQFAIEKRRKHRDFTAGTQVTAGNEGWKGELFFCTIQHSTQPHHAGLCGPSLICKKIKENCKDSLKLKIISINFSTSSVTSWASSVTSTLPCVTAPCTRCRTSSTWWAGWGSGLGSSFLKATSSWRNFC